MDFDVIRPLLKTAESKAVLWVLDGLGGLAAGAQGQTELQAARTPHLDALAREGICGLHSPVGPGITPGSGPSHLALFGYDPTAYRIGRGVLSALGTGFDLEPGDVAARGNFCRIDEQGRVTDRRAGRIDTEENRELCKQLRRIEVPGVQLFVETVKQHRFLLVLRGEGLGAELSDTDPQETGRRPQKAEGSTTASDRTARAVREFVEQAGQILAEQERANMILLRGFAQRPQWPSFREAFGFKAAAIAGYPMYRGLARLLGMQVLPLPSGADLADQLDALREFWAKYDFFYCHVKGSDSAGEDGDFKRKVRVIEAVDSVIPALRELGPDVLVVTGDHATPALLKQHSWHTVPVLLWSRNCRSDAVSTFDEGSCVRGGLGPRLPAADLMALILGHAGRLAKYGA